MAITLGSFTFNTLTAQPFGYEELEAYSGLSARRWRVSGLCTPAQWHSIITEYTTWRASRINDEDTLKSRVIGTTVSLTAKAAGVTWTGIACWFTAAPSAEQTGAYLSVSFELVDANQYLAALLAQQAKSEERNKALDPDLGTITIGSAVLTLKKPPHTYANNPQVQLTATGQHYISGPLAASRIRDVEGTCNQTNWDLVQSWFEGIIPTTPAAGTWYPNSAPTASATAEIIDGVKTTIYTVSIQLIQL
jgi:hypothetical protein